MRPRDTRPIYSTIYSTCTTPSGTPRGILGLYIQPVQPVQPVQPLPAHHRGSPNQVRVPGTGGGFGHGPPGAHGSPGSQRASGLYGMAEPGTEVMRSTEIRRAATLVLCLFHVSSCSVCASRPLCLSVSLSLSLSLTHTHSYSPSLCISV